MGFPLHEADGDREPTDAELAAIEAEWPVIEGELALVDAQIAALVTRQEASELERRRLRRAERRVLGSWRALASVVHRPDSYGEEVA